MTVEKEVDDVLSLHESVKPKKTEQPSHLKRWHWIVLGVICLSLGTVLLLSAVDKRWVESFFGAREKPIVTFAEETNVSIPYHYWYAPTNGTFGIRDMILINETFWMELANDTIDWFLEQSVNGNNWNDCTELLNVTKTWNPDNISYKYDLNFTTDSKQYYRIIKRTNLSSNLQSWRDNSSGNRYLLNFSVTDNESYNCSFDWSDYENSDFANISHTDFMIKVSQNLLYFEFMIISDDKLDSGETITIDPIFGDDTEYATTWQSSNDAEYTHFGSPASSGTIQYSQAYFRNDVNGETAQMAVYWSDNMTRIPYGLSDNMSIDAEGGFSWHNFTWSSNPIIWDDESYLIAVGTTSADLVQLVQSTGGDSGWDKNHFLTTMDWPNPLIESAGFAYIMSAYVGYSPLVAPPSRIWQDVPSMDWNISFSNTTINQETFSYNVSFSNITTYTEPFSFNISFSNTTVDTEAFSFNISFSNTTFDVFVFSYNISFSNTTTDTEAFSYNVSWSNTTTDVFAFSFNISFSNTSDQSWQQPFSFNISFSNTTIVEEAFAFNVSFSNTTNNEQTLSFNCSFSNTSVNTQAFSWNVSFSNSSLDILNTTVDSISPYNQTISPLEITATSHNETPDNVTLWYRHSTDNSTWGTGGDNHVFGYYNATMDNNVDSNGNRIYGSAAIPTANGTANNISVYIRANNPPQKFKCALYYNNTDKYIAESEERTFTSDDGFNWEVFDISANINISTEFKIVVWGNKTGSNIGYCNNSVGWAFRDVTQVYNGFPTDITESAIYVYDIMIYVSYTEENGTGWTTFGTDTVAPWSWNFNFPNSTGYYEFYSIANLSGQANESAPVSADALCHYTVREWNQTFMFNVSFSNSSVPLVFNQTMAWNCSFSNSSTPLAWQQVDAFNCSFSNSSAADNDTNYYVSNTGNDSHAGTSPATAWQTVGKVNSELSGVINQSDDIYFNRGDTFSDDGLELRLGGTSADWMVIAAYGTGADPIISGSNGNGHNIDLYLTNLGYIQIENIDCQGATGNGVQLVETGSHNLTLSNVDVTNAGNNGIRVTYVDHYKIENCTVTNAGLGGILIYGGGSGAYLPTRNGFVMNCTVDNVSTDGYTLHRQTVGIEIGANHYLFNCTATGCGEDGFDITSGTDIYIGNCTGYANTDRVMSVGHDVNRVFIENFHTYNENRNILVSSAHNLTIRESIFEDIEHPTVGDMLYVSSEGTEQSWDTSDVVVYNNDFIYYDGTLGVSLGRANTNIDRTTFKNNIFHSVYQSAPTTYLYVWGTRSFADVELNSTYNMWWRGDGLPSDHWYDTNGADNWAEWLGEAEVDNDLRDDPEIAEAGGTDFSLNSTSPCIDAGDWLTETVGGDTGTLINVSESNYFFQGIPILNIVGDNIFVGDDTDLLVTAINCSENTITVNRSITWANGESVSLSSYSGSAPDIGAREFTGTPASTWQETMNWDISFSNSSRAWQQTSAFNVSFSNTTADNEVFSFNVSFSNTTDHIEVFSWDVSFSNSSQAWQQTMAFNVSFSNSSTPPSWNWTFSFNVSFGNYSTLPYITAEYPANESNILVVQPTVYFNLTSPLGYLMNYTVYIGSSADNCNTWLCSANNVVNGTYRNDSQYYSAVNYTTYYWRVHVDDGSASIDEVFSFRSIRQGGVITRGINPLILVALLIAVISLIYARVYRRRK